MIWRVVVVVLCIIIITTAVWAASNSFAVSVEGPYTFDASVTVATPTPAVVEVNQPFTLSEYDSGSPDPLPFDVSVPSAHVVLMTGRQDDNLEVFHLCTGEVVDCVGGIMSVNAQFLDRDRDNLADNLRVYFDKDQFEALLLSTVNASVGGVVAAADTSASTTVDGTRDETTSSATGADLTSHVNVYKNIGLTISGEIYAWRIAVP